MKVGIAAAFGDDFWFCKSGGGVNIGGGSFSFRGGGVNIGGTILLLSGNFGGEKVGGGRNTTGGPAGVDSGLGTKVVEGCPPYSLARVNRSRFVGKPFCSPLERKYMTSEMQLE